MLGNQHQQLRSTYTLEHYLEIIKIIYEKHLTHTGKWLSEQTGVTHYNLKKTQVRSIYDIKGEGISYIDPSFYQYMLNYKDSLFKLYVNIITEIKEKCNFDIKGRIKNEDSILLKLHKKRNEQGGTFSINKVLNDLLGFRLIDEDFEQNIHKVQSLLDDLKHNSGYRLIYKPRQNGDYNGYHIYFMGKDAKYFPIELQIWDAKNEQKNLQSHEIYKKEYTAWPKLYHRG
jgi:ppGpp synthetase/RelA/SpoT-type nucleotidyltranferase